MSRSVCNAGASNECRSLCVQISRERSYTPCQYIDTTRKAIVCATTLQLKVFGRLFVKRFALCYRSVVLSCLSVCDVRALRPNGWTDEDETWLAGRPRPWPHCVRWEPSSPCPKGAQLPHQFSAHICCGQMAAWITMSLGMKLGSTQATLC